MKRPSWPLAPLMLIGVLGAAAADAQTVEPWTPKAVSSPRFESHGAFDPKTHDFVFVRSAPNFSGWRLMVSRCGDKGLGEPVAPTFAGPGLEADPYFTPDGHSLYFISTRATGSLKAGDLDLWRVDRDAGGGWGAPVRLPEPINSAFAEWFPRPASDGWLYFGSGRPGGQGGMDIWRARQDGKGAWTVENAGPGVNTAGNEYEAAIAPDGRSMIINVDDGLYQSTAKDGAWGSRVRLPAPVNVNGSEIGALHSPSGRSVLFARDTRTAASGEFFVWRAGGAEAWPDVCPGKAGATP